jgi:hypothetical protein
MKILSIGNSFSCDATRYLHGIAHADKVDIESVNLYIGGCPLDRHFRNLKGDYRAYELYFNGQATGFNMSIKEALLSREWDVVTIQQASGKSAFYDTYQPYADNLIAKICELAPQAEIVIQQTWSYAPYDGRLEKWKMTPKEMYEALKKAYAQLAAKHGLRIIPTADAVQLFRDRLPVDYGRLLTRNEISKIEKPAVIDFHGDVVGASSWKQGRKNRQKDWREIKLRNDFSHFNARGNYLQACVWLGFLFNVDPVTFTYCPKGLPEADARLMRECARDALKASR